MQNREREILLQLKRNGLYLLIAAKIAASDLKWIVTHVYVGLWSSVSRCTGMLSPCHLLMDSLNSVEVMWLFFMCIYAPCPFLPWLCSTGHEFYCSYSSAPQVRNGVYTQVLQSLGKWDGDDEMWNESKDYSERRFPTSCSCMKF